MKNNNSHLRKKYYQYTREIRVDQAGSGDTVTIQDACVMAAAITPRDIFNRVMISVNNGIYIEEEIDIPSYTSIVGRSSHGTNARNGILVLSGLGEPLTAADSWFMRMNEFSSISNMTIQQGRATPTNLAAPYSFVLVNNWAVMENLWLVTNDTNYNGVTFPYYGINITDPTSEFLLDDCRITSQGDETIGVRSVAPVVAYYTMFEGDPQGWLDLYHTDLNIKTGLTHCRMYSDLAFPGQKRAVDWVIRASSVNTGIKLTSTRVELNERSGSGTYQEMHPTPQQLETQLRATVRTTAINTTIDGYADGTIERTAGDVTMPPLSETVDGQAFVVVNNGVTATNIPGNGALIDGLATYVCAIGDRCIIQRVGAGWVVLSAGGTGGVPSLHAPTHEFGGTDVVEAQSLGSGAASVSNSMITDGLGGWVLSPPNGRAGQVLAGTFAGSPLKATVTFGTAFSDALYSVSIIGADSRIWTVETQLAGSFIINSNSIVGLTAPVSWTATKHGVTP